MKKLIIICDGCGKRTDAETEHNFAFNIDCVAFVKSNNSPWACTIRSGDQCYRNKYDFCVVCKRMLAKAIQDVLNSLAPAAPVGDNG